MSRLNKVNPDHYKTGGRLTPDELARERAKQRAKATPRVKAWAPAKGGPFGASGSIGAAAPSRATRTRKRKA